MPRGARPFAYQRNKFCNRQRIFVIHYDGTRLVPPIFEDQFNRVMKRIILITFAAAAVALGASVPAANDTTAAPDSMRAKLRKLFPGVSRVLRDFHQQAPLSDVQRSQVREILKSHKSEITTQFKTGKDARRAMFDAVEQSGPDSPLALKAADIVGAAASSRALLAGKIRSEILPILTPEQKKLVTEAHGRIRNRLSGRLSGHPE